MRRLLLTLLLLLPLAGRAEAAPADYPLADGYFFTEAGGGSGNGFLVSDADGAPFLSELWARGGPAALGYPISRRFVWKGTLVQAFQKTVLQWLPSQGKVAYLNVFDDMSAAGLDDWLGSNRATPKHAWLDDEAKLAWDDVMAGRLAFLEADPAIKARYYAVGDPMALYGLPSSRVEDMGNHYAIRLQRAVIQRWKVDVPWAKAGETTVANGGDIAKEAGMFPPAPLRPTGPDGVSSPAAPAPLAATVPTSFADPPPKAIPPAGAAKRVALDPGHGGREIGAVGRLPQGELREKDVNLDIAKKAAAILRAAGYQVALTREADVYNPPSYYDNLQARVDVADNFKADAFVSIHNNGIRDPAQHGLEVYYATGRPFSADNLALARQLYSALGRHMAAAGYDPFERGVKPDTMATGDGDHFFVLAPQGKYVKRATTMPSALGESLFLTNGADAAQLARPEMRDAIARGYALGIAQFLQGRKPGP